MKESEIMGQVAGFEIWTKQGQLIATYGKDQLQEARSHISGTTHVLQYILKGKEKTARVASSVDSSGGIEELGGKVASDLGYPEVYDYDMALIIHEYRDRIDLSDYNAVLEFVADILDDDIII